MLSTFTAKGKSAEISLCLVAVAVYMLSMPISADARVSLTDLENQINALQIQVDDLRAQVNSTVTVPIGTVVAWLKNYTNTPSIPEEFMECNGQVVSDSDSPYYGQNLPNLNGNGDTQRFLRGSTTSGAIGGSETHSHGLSVTPAEIQHGGVKHLKSSRTGSSSTLPSYYEVVWIIRIK